jgi:hypothetical protein
MTGSIVEELDISGASEESGAGVGMTVVYDVTITRGGTCKDMFDEASAGAFDAGGVGSWAKRDDVGTFATSEVDSATEADCWVSVGMADSIAGASDVGDATSDGEGDGNTVVYSVLVTTRRDVESAMSEANSKGGPLDVEAESVRDSGLSRVAEVDVWTTDSITEEAPTIVELTVLFVVCRL